MGVRGLGFAFREVGVSVQHPGSGGILFKLGLVVLSIGVCALSMLVMRQARLQAAHEVTQTQLRIQRADEQLWKMRADIAGLSNPARIRELAGNMGPMHALINPVEYAAAPSTNLSIPMVEKMQPVKGTSKTDATGNKADKPGPSASDARKGPDKAPSKSSDKPSPGTAKPDQKKDGKQDSKPENKPKPRPSSISPTGLASVPAPKVRDLNR